jgi:hypothetical protein
VKTTVIAVCAMLCLTGDAFAQQRPTLREALHQTLDESSRRCPMGKEFDDPTNPEARRKFMDEMMNEAICGCLPKKIHDALKTLPENELAKQVTLEDMKAYMPRMLEPCLGSMFRELFSGEQCLAMLPARAEKVPADFCACMKPEVDKFSDAEAVQLGSTGSQYRTAVEEARKAGKPPPEQSPLMARLTQRMKHCAGQP